MTSNYAFRSSPILSVIDEFSRLAGKLGGVRARARTHLERVAGIEPASSAWKAEVLPLNYTRRLIVPQLFILTLVEGEGFEPSKAKPSDLQSDPFDHSGTPPNFPHFHAQTRQTGNFLEHKSTIELTFIVSSMVPSAHRPEDRPTSASPAAHICHMYWCRHKESNPGPSHYK